jgi:hypothetical protein
MGDLPTQPNKTDPLVKAIGMATIRAALLLLLFIVEFFSQQQTFFPTSRISLTQEEKYRLICCCCCCCCCCSCIGRKRLGRFLYIFTLFIVSSSSQRII